MSRYITATAPPARDTAWSDDAPTIVHPTAIVSPPVDTGLVDADGRRIYRVPDEIGFLPRRER